MHYKQIILILTVLWLSGCSSSTSNLDHKSSTLPSAIAVNTLKELEEKAKAGDAKAQNMVGLMYHKGNGVKQDYKKAFIWFKKAAKQGLADAQWNLALYYEKDWLHLEPGQDTGIPKDLKKYAYWLKKAATQEHVLAQNNLGKLYVNPKDWKKAINLLTKAANQGFYIAQYNLSHIYAGEDIFGTKLSYIPLNYEKAIEWREKAAGDPKELPSTAWKSKHNQHGGFSEQELLLEWYKEKTLERLEKGTDLNDYYIACIPAVDAEFFNPYY